MTNKIHITILFLFFFFNLKSQEINMENSFKNIKINVFDEVNIIYGNEYKTVIQIPEEYRHYVEKSIENETLYLSHSQLPDDNISVKIDIYVPALSSVEGKAIGKFQLFNDSINNQDIKLILNSIGSVEIKNNSLLNNLFFNADSIGEISINASIENFTGDITACGPISINSDINNVEIELTSTGRFTLNGNINNANIKADVVDGMDLLVKNKLNIEASLSKEIKVGETPKFLNKTLDDFSFLTISE